MSSGLGLVDCLSGQGAAAYEPFSLVSKELRLRLGSSLPLRQV